MNVLISIKPKYVKKIISGEKKYEYRKKIFKKDVEKVYIYSSSPEKKIIGYFEYNGYKKGSPDEIWAITKETAGIKENEFKRYFNNKFVAYAITIKKCVVYKKPIDPYLENSDFRAPQSFMYIQGWV